MWLVPLLCENIFTLGFWPEIKLYYVNSKNVSLSGMSTKNADVSNGLVEDMLRSHMRVGSVNVSLPGNYQDRIASRIPNTGDTVN